MSLVIRLAYLAVKLGEAVNITVDIVNAFPRRHTGLETRPAGQTASNPC